MLSDKFYDQRKWVALACILMFFLNFSAYYPGFLSYDSVDQYMQALTGRYDDWHPPVMAALWSIFIKIIKGPVTMLVFQLSIIWGTVYLLLDTIKGWQWKVLIMLFSLAPFVQNFAGYIIKDVQMAWVWLLATAIMLRVVINRRVMTRFEIIACILLMLYGLWLRQNALPGVIPICWVFAKLLFQDANRLQRAVFVMFFLIFSVAGQWVFSYKILKAEKAYPQNKLFMQDITGIYAKTGKSYYPDWVYRAPILDTALLRKSYDPATFDHLWFNKNVLSVFAEPEADRVGALQKQWLKSIAENPRIYLKNRYNGFLNYLRIRKRNVEFIYIFPYMDDNPYGFEYHENFVSKIFLRPIDWQKDMPYMQPWFWFFINLLLLVFIPFFRDNSFKIVYCMLILSALLYVLPDFFIYQTDTDFRYFYWNCIACCISICILVADKIQKWQSNTIHFIRMHSLL